MARNALVELRDRMVARAALIVERHEHPTVVRNPIPEDLRQYVDPIVANWEANAPPWDRPAVVGCTGAEIRAIEDAHGVVIPELYREFLELMGRSVADLDAGTVWLYPHLVDLKRAAIELLAECRDPIPLSPGALVVAMHQGSQFTWIDTRAGSDPAVWHWIENTPEPTEPAYAGWIEYLLHQESNLRNPEFHRFSH